MDLYLQMGHGMQEMCIELIKMWGKGTVILSPVNIPPTKIITYAKKIKLEGGSVLFDPQMFYPKEGHSKLKLYDYWPGENVSISENECSKSINREIFKINEQIQSSRIILPSIEMNDTKIGYGIKCLSDSANYFKEKTDKDLLATLCLYPETIRNISIIEQLVEQLKKLPVQGYYIVAHPANNEYIVSDPLWMMGMLKLLTCLKLAQKLVIVGYSNHQGLIYSLAHVDAIASGNYMNTRSFVPSKFKSPQDDDIKHKSTWYYHPTAMSEYKAALLDIAKQRNFLDSFKPQGDFENIYSEMLFKGATPSSTNYKEPNSFKHYLHCLNVQCMVLSKKSYEETFDMYNFLLNNAENLIKEYKKRGVSGQNRDFYPAIEVNRVAMCTIDEDYGLKLRFDWNDNE